MEQLYPEMTLGDAKDRLVESDERWPDYAISKCATEKERPVIASGNMVAVPGTGKRISAAWKNLDGRRFRHAAGRLRR